MFSCLTNIDREIASYSNFAPLYIIFIKIFDVIAIILKSNMLQEFRKIK